MFKRIMPLVVLSLVFAVACTASGKYGDIKALHSETISAMNDYSSKIESAKTGKEVANAMTSFSVKINKIMIKGKKLEKKYPELAKKEDIPELKESEAKMEKAQQRMTKAMSMAVPKFMGDKNFMKAMQEMSKNGMGMK